MAVRESLPQHRGAVEPAVILEDIGMSGSCLIEAVDRREEVGVVEVEPNGTIQKLHRKRDIGSDARRAVAAQRQDQQLARSRLEVMRKYSDHDSCRRANLVGYFGESYRPPCGTCDDCLSGHGVPVKDQTVHPIPIAGTVRHREYGEGTVLRYEDDLVMVLFRTVGYRTVLVDLA